MSEPNQVLWRGIRPIDPPEYLPISFFKHNTEQHVIHNSVSGSTVTLLTVPTGHIYHIINIFTGLLLHANGAGYIVAYDENDITLAIIQRYFSDTYRVLCPPVVLLSPIDLTENQYITISSDTSGFTLYVTIVYTEE